MMQCIMRMKLRNLFYVVLFCCFLLIVYQSEVNIYFWSSESLEDLPIIIWWTPFTLRDELELTTCSNLKCAVTDNRKYINNAKAFLFYGSNFMGNDLPLPRNSTHIWGLAHEESPKNIALMLDDNALSLFNFSSTFSRYSDLPLTLQYLPSLDLLTGFEYFVPTHEKNSYLNKIAPVLYIQSDCQTPLERDSYVVELMKYIQVDSYGKCLNNKKLDVKLAENHLEDLYAKDYMKFVARYKFIIAFENSICDDYITEKLWRPLIVGSIPIYLGSPSVQDWLPNGKSSAILVQDFESPKKLAEYIHKVNNDKHLYENYLQHKLSDIFKITNNNLTSLISNKKYDPLNNLFHEFECQICENIHLNVKKNSLRRNEYNCPVPVSPLTGERNMSNWWIDHWRESKCHWKMVKNVIDDELTIDKDTYDRNIRTMIRKKMC